MVVGAFAVFGWAYAAPALRRYGEVPIPQFVHGIGQSPDKIGMCRDGWDANVVGCASLGCMFRVFDIEFDQRFGMLGYEGDRNHYDRFAFCGGAFDLVVGIGPEPFKRPNAALITDREIQFGKRQFFDDRRDRPFDMILIGISGVDYFLRQAMGGK